MAVAQGGRSYVLAVGSDEQGSPGSLLELGSTGVVRRTAVGAAPQGLAVASDGRTLYVFGGIDAAATPLTRPVTLTPVVASSDHAGRPIDVGTLPSRMVVSPHGALVYVLDTSASGDGRPTVITPVDTATGTVRAPIAVAATALAFAPDGAMAYAADPARGVVPIVAASGRPGAAIPLGPFVPVDLAVTPDGRSLLVLESPDPGLAAGAASGWRLVEIDTATARVTRAVALGVRAAAPGGSLAIAPSGAVADALIDGSASSAVELVAVELASGRASRPVAVGCDADALALGPGGGTAYVLDAGRYGGARSPGNTPAAVVPVAAGAAHAGKPVPAGLAAGSLVIAPGEG